MNRERGQAFVLVLIVMAVGAILIVPFLQMTNTGLKSRQMYGEFIGEDYAAISAIEYGMWRLKWEPGFAAGLPIGEESPPFEITVNGSTASTTIVAQAPPGQLSGQPLAGRAGDVIFKVSKTVVPSVTVQALAYDGFESANGSGGTGSWTSNWTLSGTYYFSTSGEHSGNYHLQLRGDDNETPGDGYAQRRVNLSGSVGAGPFLIFWARCDSFEYDDNVVVKVSTNGTNWDTLKTFVNGDDDSYYHSYQYDLSSYGKPATFYVAFDTNLSSSGDYFYVDDVTFGNTAPTTDIQPGVLTQYTYYVTIQCLAPGGGYLDRIIDNLPERGASSGDYMQYINGSTSWDQAMWGMAPFNPTDINTLDSYEERHQELEWDFEDAGHSDVHFDYGEIKTFTFRAQAALTEGVYGNTIEISARTYGSPDYIITAATASFEVGNPVDPGIPGGLLTVNKVASPIVITPGILTTVTYTITLENVDTDPVRIYEIEDWLPTTGSSVSSESFVYVANSAHGTVIGRPSKPALLYDNFNRANENTISNWTDSDGSGTAASVYSNYVRLRTTANVNIIRPNISTVGYTGIVLSYRYARGGSSGTNPQLKVEWKPSSSGTWSQAVLATETCTNDTWQTAPPRNLPAGANNTSIDIRFTDITGGTREALLDEVKLTTATAQMANTPVGMPDSNSGTDFFYNPDGHGDWWSTSRRWELNWKFDDYPSPSDAVWNVGSVCQGHPYPIVPYDYDPYLELDPGEILEVVFQATVNLSASGSYYDEVFVRIDDEWWDQEWLYSYPSGEVTVPQYDLQVETLNSILRASAGITSNGFWWRSWHWKHHR